MADYSNLSNEELVALLKNNEGSARNVPTANVEDAPLFGQCQFKPSRPKNAPQCVDGATTSYGFCKKHSRTVQAKKARDLHEANQLIAEIEEERGIEEKLPPVTEIEGGLHNERETPIALLTPKKTTVSKPKTPEKSKVAAKKAATKAKKTAARSASQPDTGKSPVQEPKRGSRQPTTRRKTIRPNYWGRYEDPDTHIVFDPTTTCAYGVQEPTGRVTALKPEHVEVCQRNGWNYNIPYDSDDEEVSSDESEGSEDESLHESDFDSDESEDSDGGEVSSEESEDSDGGEVSSEEDEVSDAIEESEGEFDSDAADDFYSEDAYSSDSGDEY